MNTFKRNEKFKNISADNLSKIKRKSSFIAWFWPLLFSLLAYRIANYFNLYSSFYSLFYFDIPVLINLNKFSTHADLFSFIWLSYLLLLPLIFLYWLLIIPSPIKRNTDVSIISFVSILSFFILLYLVFIFITPDGLSERRREGFQGIFDSYLAFYLFFITPLTTIPFLLAFSLKNFSIFKFLFRT